jgi:hypothetical protein
MAMKNQRGRLIAVGAVVASAVIAVPGAGATKPAPKAEPDLAVNHVTIPQGYVVVEHNGRAAPIHVRVSLKNVGHARAPASTTSILLLQNGRRIDRQEVPAGPLAPGHATTQIAIFRGVEPALGHLHGGAIADPAVHGTFDNDSKTSDPVPVIARRWRANGLEVDVHSPALTIGSTEDENTSGGGGGIVFTFSHVGAGRFVYTASGTVVDTATFSGECTGEGDTSATKPRWGGDSALSISTSLKQYQATLRASLAAPFTVGVSCHDIAATVPMTVRFHDLFTRTKTSTGPLPMSPTEHHLVGNADVGSLFTFHYGWDLAADVP